MSKKPNPTLAALLDQVEKVEEVKRKEDKSGGGDPRVLNLKQGATYIGRFIFAKTVDDTFVSYDEVGWQSFSSGEYVFAGRSPKDAGIKDDTLKKQQWEAYKKAKEVGDKTGMDRACKLIPKRKQLANFYLHKVVNDDAQKSKEGTVVVFKYPAQLDKDGNPSSDIYKIIHSGIFGDKKVKIGIRAFDLTDSGRSLIIEVTKKDNFNNYSQSSWDDVEGLGLSDEQIEKIQGSIIELKELVPVMKSKEEIQKLLDDHFYCKNANTEDELKDDEKPDDDEPETTSGNDDFDGLLDGVQ